MTLSAMGEFALARDHLAHAGSFDYSVRRSFYGAAALSWEAMTLVCLGYPSQGLDRGRRALALAREASDPLAYVNALNNVCAVHQLRQEAKASLDLAEEALRLSIQYGFQWYSAFALFGRGCALTELNQVEEGLEQMRRGIAEAQASGQASFSLEYAALAKAFLKAGRTADGLAMLAEGLEVSHRNSDGENTAELWRIRGDLQLLQAAPSGENQAENSYRQAIEIARHQQAKWWELRATVSLARLLAKCGRRDEARAMLSETYNWFTEGFDTADLKEAKALLDQLQT
jgi:predicted ATPase